MNTPRRVFITDCEGPVSKNDNAFELTSYFVPDGETLFTHISKYDDVLADIVKRKGYKAGDTLKLILPFLKAYDVTDEKIVSFSTQSLLLMPGAKETLQNVRTAMPVFIVSTSYEHYIRALCPTLGFPYEDTYCTRLNLDAYRISNKEKEQLKRLGQEICAMQMLEISERAVSIQMLSRKNQQIFRRLDEIFWEEIMQLESGTIIREVNPMGGAEKAKVAREIVAENGCNLDSVLYVGDSITDVECFRLVRENGGLTVSFNGNAYAVREADIAILSPNTMVVAVLADVFKRLGHDAIYRLVDEWSYSAMERHGVDPSLRERMRGLFKGDLPKLSKVTAGNVEQVTAESNAFRKLARGQRVGSLG